MLKNVYIILSLAFFLYLPQVKYYAAEKGDNNNEEEEQRKYNKWAKSFDKKIDMESKREVKMLKKAPITSPLLNLITTDYVDTITNLNLLLQRLCYNNTAYVNDSNDYPQSTYKNFEDSIGLKIENIKKKIVFIGPLNGPVFIASVLEWCINHQREIDNIVFLGDFCEHKEDNDILYVLSIIHLFFKIFKNKIILIHGNNDYHPFFRDSEHTEEDDDEEETTNEKPRNLWLIKCTKNNVLYEMQEGNAEWFDKLYRSIAYNAIFTFENGKRVYCAQNTLPFSIKQNKEGEYIIDNTKYISGLPSIVHDEDEKDFEKHNRAFSNRLNLNEEDSKSITKEGKHFLIGKSIFEDFMIENGIDSCVYYGNENKRILFADDTKSINIVHSKMPYKKTSDKDNEENKDNEEDKDNEEIERDKKPSIFVIEGDNEYHITVEDMIKKKKKRKS